VKQQVDKAATTVDLTAAPNPSVIGQSVTFTATVSAAAGTPTGSVEFFNGSASLGTVGLSDGVAALEVSDLTVGTHNITARYGGDDTFAASESHSASFEVEAADTTHTIFLPILYR
jgi:hypothetical protein